MAWEEVQKRKEDGGLGVKDLHLQNKCLLMKFIDKLFADEPVAWKDWLVRDADSFDAPIHGCRSYLWRIVEDELDTCHSLTKVSVGDGASTSF